MARLSTMQPTSCRDRHQANSMTKVSRSVQHSDLRDHSPSPSCRGDYHTSAARTRLGKFHWQVYPFPAPRPQRLARRYRVDRKHEVEGSKLHHLASRHLSRQDHSCRWSWHHQQSPAECLLPPADERDRENGQCRSENPDIVVKNIKPKT